MSQKQVTRRAIEEPSAGPRDLAGKACLSLHHMDRFLPERTHPDDLHRLLRVILREVMAAGGIGEHRQTIGSVVPQTPAGAGKAIVGLASVAAAADPIFAAIEAWEAAERAWTAFSDAAERIAERGPAFFEEDRRLGQALASALDVALSTVPTTRAGQLALLDLLRRQMREYGQADGGPPDEDSPIWRDSYHVLFAALAASIVRGQSPPEPAASAAAHMEQHEYALHRALTAHRVASRRQQEASIAADEVAGAGGDTSNEAMAPRQEAEAATIEATFRAWRAMFEVRPRTLHELSMMLAYIAERFDAHRGMEDEPDVFGALIGAVDGLRIGSEELTATHNLSLLSIGQLEGLADTCDHQSEVLSAFEGRCSETPLGVILDRESNRLGILGNHARDEIDRRRPATDDDRNLRLEALIKADLAGNGYIEPALLAEAVAAWGTR